MKTIIFAMSLLITTAVYGEIKEIHNIQELEDAIPTTLSKTEWVLFDIDYTLTEPDLPAFQMQAIKNNKQRFKGELEKFQDQEKLLIPLLMITQAPSRLTDPAVLELIQKLQNQHINILGFTAIDTASIPDIGSVPQWRQNELKRLGIDFTPKRMDSPFPKEKVEFTQFTPFRKTYPLYQNGILYANVTPSKGEVLGAFLDIANVKPSKIIFIDDNLDNLKGVESEMDKRGIKFQGLHFKVQADSTPTIFDDNWNKAWTQARCRAQQITQLDGQTHN